MRNVLAPKRTLRQVDREVNQVATKIQNDKLKLGALLLEISVNNLYKEKFKTFEAYLESKQGIGKARGYRLIEAQKTRVLLSKNVAKNDEFGDTLGPQNEAQLRPLSSLDAPEQKVYVWEKACEAAKDAGKKRPAMVDVQAAVDEFKSNPIDLAPVVEPTFEPAKLTSAKQGVLYTPGDNDECYTPEYAVRALLPHLERFRGKTIWCPFDKPESRFVTVLEAEGFDVVSSHIESGQDFYTHEPIKWDLMVSNPPFTNKRKIFERALQLGNPFALIMSNTWLNDSAPKQIFKERGLELLMFEERMKFLNQDNSENKITFSSSYFCCDFLKHPIMFDSLRNYGYGA